MFPINNKQNFIISIYAILLITYTILFATIPFPRNTTTVLQFLFGIISICFGCFVTFNAFCKATTIKSVVYGFPVVYISILYTICQILLSFIFFIINIFIEVPAWIGSTFSILLLALAIIGVIATDNTKDIISNIEESEKNNLKNIQYFKLEINSIYDKCVDKEAKKQLLSLYEKLKYSDPVSNNSLEETENKIKTNIQDLSKLIDKGDYSDVILKIQLISNLLNERNRKCITEKN